MVNTRMPAPEDKLNYAGVLMINSPYGFETEMRAAARLLAPRLEGDIMPAWVAGSE
jgi:23S rRNA A2030 N6-methylase RlmJ